MLPKKPNEDAALRIPPVQTAFVDEGKKRVKTALVAGKAKRAKTAFVAGTTSRERTARIGAMIQPAAAIGDVVVRMGEEAGRTQDIIDPILGG